MIMIKIMIIIIILSSATSTTPSLHLRIWQDGDYGITKSWLLLLP